MTSAQFSIAHSIAYGQFHAEHAPDDPYTYVPWLLLHSGYLLEFSDGHRQCGLSKEQHEAQS